MNAVFRIRAVRFENETQCRYVTGCTKLTAGRFQTVAAMPSRLEVLRCARTAIACDLVIALVCSRWGSSLRVLELGTATAQTGITNVSLRAIGRHCPSLEALGVSGAHVDDEDLGRAISDLKSLTVVDVSGCRDLSRSTRQAALDGNPLAVLAAIRKARAA